MTLRSLGQWLGIARTSPLAGLHVNSERVVLAAIRPDPLRLVALGRRTIPGSAIVADEVGPLEPVIAAIAELRLQLHLPQDTATVVTMEPRPSAISLDFGSVGERATCPVAAGAYDRLSRSASRAGLRVVSADVVPASVARLCLARDDGSAPDESGFGGSVALRDPSGWSVVIGPGFLDAERVEPAARVGTLQVGSDLHRTGPIETLPIHTPRRLDGFPDLRHDGPAIGAALAGFGLSPEVSLALVDDPVSVGWSAELIDFDPATQPRMNHRV
ncbi:MAG: hypothetical protein ACR2QK_19250 [Acidimicrobiales bacterium]